MMMLRMLMLLMLVLDVQGVGDLSLQHLDVVVADAVVRGQELLHKECDQPRVLTVHGTMIRS